jgi:hypothetical protein
MFEGAGRKVSFDKTRTWFKTSPSTRRHMKGAVSDA